jgi:hypothetical protein
LIGRRIFHGPCDVLRLRQQLRVGLDPPRSLVPAALPPRPHHADGSRQADELGQAARRVIHFCRLLDTTFARSGVARPRA